MMVSEGKIIWSRKKKNQQNNCFKILYLAVTLISHYVYVYMHTYVRYMHMIIWKPIMDFPGGGVVCSSYQTNHRENHKYSQEREKLKQKFVMFNTQTSLSLLSAYYMILIVVHFYQRSLNPHSWWRERFLSLLVDQNIDGIFCPR